MTDSPSVAAAGGSGRLVVQSGPGVSLSVYLGAVAPDTAYAGERELTWEQPAPPSRHRAPLRAAVRRVGERLAGCLGAEFVPEPDGSRLVVAVRVGDTPGQRPGTAGTAAREVGAAGLEPWAAEAVLQGVRGVARSSTVRDLGAGQLVIRWGWQHDIDSSAAGFAQLAARLVGLLGVPATATAEDVWATWRRTRDSVTIATMLDGLDAVRARYPHAGTFGPGASDAVLAELARDLDVPLPEALRTVLARVNGGAFDPSAGPVPPRGAAPPAPRAWCTLLSVDEIRAAYADLIAAHAADAEVERWAGRWPVRARYRARDGTSVPWPFLPVCRTLGARELLVLTAVGPFGDGPVLGAFRGLAPREWRPVYDGFAALFEAFVVGGGEVRLDPGG